MLLSSICFFFYFFFYGYGDHRDLHSFPTRRSSDLVPRLCHWHSTQSRNGRELQGGDFGGATDGGGVRPTPLRSEEHTSELQSLRHLVCRLLLEKKKKNKQ